MSKEPIEIRPGLKIQDGEPFFLIAGPCVLESQAEALLLAQAIKTTCRRLGIPYIFKASFDKANRTAGANYRGPGIKRGLDWLEAVGEETGVPILTDFHEAGQAGQVAAVADILQIPALLSRQTDLLEAAAWTGKTVNIKKGQWMAPEDVGQAAAKVSRAGGSKILLTERGTAFGYHDVVADMRSIPRMAQLGWPVVFDASHTCQAPSALGFMSGGDRSLTEPLAAAALAAGADGIFIEVHPEPVRARSDGPSSTRLADLDGILERLLRVAEARRR